MMIISVVMSEFLYSLHYTSLRHVEAFAPPAHRLARPVLLPLAIILDGPYLSNNDYPSLSG